MVEAQVEARVEAHVNEVVDARVDAVVGERVAAKVASFKSQFEWMTSQLQALQAFQRTTSTGSEPSAPDDIQEECYLHLDEPRLRPVPRAYKLPNQTPSTGRLSRMIK